MNTVKCVFISVFSIKKICLERHKLSQISDINNFIIIFITNKYTIFFLFLKLTLAIISLLIIQIPDQQLIPINIHHLHNNKKYLIIHSEDFKFFCRFKE